MKPSVSESPDVVRRFAPPLTKRQLGILTSCPYEAPGRYQNAGDLQRARALVRTGLLEENPSSRGEFRVTAEAQDVVRVWEAAGWVEVKK
jgi:hypothetical protein